MLMLDLEIRVKNLKSQESMLEWILATSPEEVNVKILLEYSQLI
jgi:hypothetical protein